MNSTKCPKKSCFTLLALYSNIHRRCQILILGLDSATGVAGVDRRTELTYHSSLRTHMENVSDLAA